MDAVTASLGKQLCDFCTKTCPAFDTKELRREYDARVRRAAKQAAPKKAADPSQKAADPSQKAADPSQKAVDPSQKGDGTSTHTNLSQMDSTAIQQTTNSPNSAVPRSNNEGLSNSDTALHSAAANQQSVNEAGHVTSAATSAHATKRNHKMFNLETYALHSLGDYPNTIRQFGTTDSYSTEPVSSVSDVCN
jgi:hypothetical protein